MLDFFSNHYLLLIILVFSPLLAGLFIVLPVFPNHVVKIRRFAKGFAALHLVYSTLFLANFNSLIHYNFTQTLPYELIPGLGITISFTMDELSCIMCILTSLLTFLALVAAKTMIHSRVKLFYALVLFLQTAILGVFCAKDLFLFFLFWELELIPMYFLISLWGGQRAKRSAMKFLLYTFGASLFMFVAIALLYAYYYKYLGIMLDIPTLILSASSLPELIQFICFVGFLIAFAVKLPIFPLHNWLPDAHGDAPTPVSMILAGVLLKMGAYGLIKFNVQAFGAIMETFAPILALLSVLGIIWASCCALVQSDIKRMVALSSIAHMGIVLLGICSMTSVGLSGAIFHMIAHGLISAGLFFGVGVVYLRFKTYKLEFLGGIAEFMPNLSYLMLILCLAAIGVPLTAGFVGEFLSILGAYATQLDYASFIQTCAIVACLGLILGALYILRMFHGVFYHVPMIHSKKIPDLSRHQTSILFVLVSAILVLGIYPRAILGFMDSFVTSALAPFMM